MTVDSSRAFNVSSTELLHSFTSTLLAASSSTSTTLFMSPTNLPLQNNSISDAANASHVPVAAIVVPSVIGVSLILAGIHIWITRRRQRAMKTPYSLGIDFREWKAGRASDTETDYTASERGMTVMSESVTVVGSSPIPGLPKFDRAIKGGRSDKSSLRSLASSFKSTRSYEQDENDLPFFERLRMLRRAGEMPARKSLIFDEATAGQIRELTAREMPLPQKERKRRKNSKSSGKVPMVPSIREVVHENVENHGEPPIHDDNPLSEPKPPVAPITDA